MYLYLSGFFLFLEFDFVCECDGVRQCTREALIFVARHILDCFSFAQPASE